MDFSKFKKIGQSRTHTIFEHPDGHTIHIAHASIDNKTKKGLKELHMSEGGSMNEKLHPRAKYAEGGPVQANPQNQQANLKEDDDSKKQIKLDFSKIFNQIDSGHNPEHKEKPQGYADGGQILEPQYLPQDLNNSKAVAEEQALRAQEEADQKAFIQANRERMNQSVMQPPRALQNVQASQQQAQVQPEFAGVSNYEIPGVSQLQAQPQQSSQPNMFEQGLEDVKSGISDQAKALEAGNQSEAAIYHQAQQQQAKQYTNFQQQFKSLNDERQALQDDIANQHIDPNRLIGSMDTVGKISTGIGLILGGLGGGLTGHENPVLKSMQQAIDNDIQAQKINLDNKHSLLSANFKQFGNLHDAVQMTHIQMNDMLMMKMKEAAATANTPQAKAALLQQYGKLEMDNALSVQQFAQRKALLEGNANGMSNPAIAISLIPKEHQNQAAKELKDIQDKSASAKNAMEIFDTLDKQALGGSLHPSNKAALIEPVAIAMAKDAAGRVNEFEFKAFKSLFPAPLDSASTRASKRKQLETVITEKLHAPTLEQFGIQVPRPVFAKPNALMKK